MENWPPPNYYNQNTLLRRELSKGKLDPSKLNHYVKMDLMLKQPHRASSTMEMMKLPSISRFSNSNLQHDFMDDLRKSSISKMS